MELHATLGNLQQPWVTLGNGQGMHKEWNSIALHVTLLFHGFTFLNILEVFYKVIEGLRSVWIA